LSGIVELQDAISNYRGLIDQYGIAGDMQARQAQKLQTAYEGITTALKRAEDLGALQEADRKIVENLIPQVFGDAVPGPGFLGPYNPLNIPKTIKRYRMPETAIQALDQATEQYSNIAERLYTQLVNSGASAQDPYLSG